MNWRIIGWIWTAVELLCAATSFGGGCYPQRSYSYNYGYYRQPYYQPVQVVNQLVGIPIPVNYQANIAQQGKTVFSYSSQPFNKPFDFNLYFTQASRATEQAAALFQQGQAAGHQSLQLAIEGSTKIAELNAKIAALKALDSPGESLRLQLNSQTHHGHTDVVPPQPTGGVSPYPAPPAGGLPGEHPPSGPPQGNDDIVTILQTKCLTCHRGTRVKRDDGETVETEHGIDLSKYVALPRELKAVVIGRIEQADPDKDVMPPSGKMTWQERAVFTREWFR